MKLPLGLIPKTMMIRFPSSQTFLELLPPILEAMILKLRI
jgi:hypothetical protein